MYFTELIIIIAFIGGIYFYRTRKGDESVGKYIVKQITTKAQEEEVNAYIRQLAKNTNHSA